MFFTEDHKSLIRNGVRLTVFTLEMARAVSEEALRLGVKARIHIKLDTGMGRIGFPCTEEAADQIAQIHQLPHIVIEGIFTHFAKADETDKTFTRDQMKRYGQMGQLFKRAPDRDPDPPCFQQRGDR